MRGRISSLVMCYDAAMEKEKLIEIPGHPRMPDESNMDYHDRVERALRDERLMELDNSAIAALERVLKEETEAPAAAVVSAALGALNRTRGKVPETIQHAGINGEPIKIQNTHVTEEQLERFIQRHAKKAQTDA